MEDSKKSNKPAWFIKSSAGDRITFLLVSAGFSIILGWIYLFGTGRIGPRGFGECAFKRTYSIPCPTCGMTRSVEAFVNGRIIKSLYIQPAAASFCIVVTAAAFFSLLSALLGVNFCFLPPIRLWQTKTIMLTAALVLAAGWAVTLARALADLP